MTSTAVDRRSPLALLPVGALVVAEHWGEASYGTVAEHPEWERFGDGTPRHAGMIPVDVDGKVSLFRPDLVRADVGCTSTRSA